MNYTGPKVRLSRKLGVALTPKAAAIMEKKSYPPGQHGASSTRKKMSDYKRQLLEKQKLRFTYNIHEKQLRNYYFKATHKQGNTSENLIQALESRLDNMVLRGGLARTIYQARQLVSHSHVQVNEKRVNLPAYTVKVDDIISIKPQSKKLAIIHAAMKNANPPGYVALSKADLSVRLVRTPTIEEVPIQCDVIQVIEFYSK